MPASAASDPAAPFVLLDDARVDDAADARLYQAPVEIVVARRAEEVGPALDRLARLSREGRHLAGTLSYEAGLALEPRLAPLLAARAGERPLLWFGVFAGYERIAAAAVPGWLAARSRGVSAAIGPLEPQISLATYTAAFARVRAAIEAGDIYQANLTFPLAGPWSGDPVALYAALRRNARAGYGGIVHDGSGLSSKPYFCAMEINTRVSLTQAKSLT